MTQLVAGVDGCADGWVAVVLADGVLRDVRWIEGVCSAFPELADVQRIAIDCPIGFGPRVADFLARRLLGGGTVFSIPERERFEGKYGPGRRISAQAHALGPRIRHITALAVSDKRFLEVHPEVCFMAMNDMRRLKHRKKSAGGVFERMRLLREHGIEIDEGSLGRAGRVSMDDLLDAAACAWTAARGNPVSLPDPPENSDGLAVAIWY